jgi:DNA-binding MarR family transcriptional regulator
MSAPVAPATQPLDGREMSAWHALLRGHAAVVRILEAELEAEQGLSLPAYEVLSHLSEAPDNRMRMSDLATCAVLTPSGLTRLVDKLSRDGLVERARCTADARVVYAVLTEAGRRRLAAAYPAHLEGVRRHYVDRLTPEQLEAVADALGGLAGTLTRECESVEQSHATEPIAP